MTQDAQLIVVPRGLEPRTLRLLAVRSNQLSYKTNDGNQNVVIQCMYNIHQVARLGLACIWNCVPKVCVAQRHIAVCVKLHHLIRNVEPQVRYSLAG